MGSNPSHFSRSGDGKDKVRNISDADLKDFPVEQVSWDNCQEFIRRLNEREADSGWTYRLPTEAEWEYACRGGASSSGGTISDGDCSFDFYFEQPTNALSSSQANFNGNYPYGGGAKGRYLERTCKVGSYRPNRLGIYDLHGNVWEWCEDSEDEGPNRVFRGGGCYDGGRDCRAATRDGGEPWWRGGHVGVRLARVPSGR
jgi:formylglycine-generating enzyme required for sulfatase activity